MELLSSWAPLLCPSDWFKMGRKRMRMENGWLEPDGWLTIPFPHFQKSFHSLSLAPFCWLFVFFLLLSLTNRKVEHSIRCFCWHNSSLRPSSYYRTLSIHSEMCVDYIPLPPRTSFTFYSFLFWLWPETLWLSYLELVRLAGMHSNLRRGLMNEKKNMNHFFHNISISSLTVLQYYLRFILFAIVIHIHTQTRTATSSLQRILSNK